MKQIKRQLVTGITAVLMAAALATTGYAKEQLEVPEDAYWDEDNQTLARWEEVEEVYEYEVYLYCDESKVKEIKTKKNYFNFGKFMTKEGDYTFRVRALAKKRDDDYSNSSWSDYSDETYVDEGYAELMKNGGKIDTDNSGPGAVKNDVAAGSWIQDETGWWYKYNDGTYPASRWFQDPADANWYYFDERGYMKTGWIDLEGSRYYCDPAGTPSGAMVTGICVIDGTEYQFGESGALIP